MAFCPNCGTQIADNVAFCPSCGKAVGQAGTGAATAAPASTRTPAPEAGYNSTAAPVAPAAPLAENVAGMLAYFTIIPAIIFLLIEPYNRNRFVRFHSFQCLFVAAALVVIDVVLMILSQILHLVPVIGWMVTALIWPLYSLAVLALWALVVIKAYQHQVYKLPIVGDLAEKQAGA
ncbi:MAG: zinc-ribbon domain-containing protein [Candidatus Korobacteraceae bacterium]|jgi:uncharacterized membrane protein